MEVAWTAARIAAIVAASNAGGSGSVVGDTTTTMMWIAGVHPDQVFEAIIASTVALVISGIIAAKQQHAGGQRQRHGKEAGQRCERYF